MIINWRPVQSLPLRPGQKVYCILYWERNKLEAGVNLHKYLNPCHKLLWICAPFLGIPLQWSAYLYSLTLLSRFYTGLIVTETAVIKILEHKKNLVYDDFVSESVCSSGLRSCLPLLILLWNASSSFCLVSSSLCSALFLLIVSMMR